MTEAPPSATDGPLGPALSPVAGATLWSGIQSIVLLYKSGSTGHTGHTGHAQSQGHRWTAPLSDSVRARSRSHAPLQGEVHSLVWKGGTPDAVHSASPASLLPTIMCVCACALPGVPQVRWALGEGLWPWLRAGLVSPDLSSQWHFTPLAPLHSRERA